MSAPVSVWVSANVSAFVFSGGCINFLSWFDDHRVGRETHRAPTIAELKKHQKDRLKTAKKVKKEKREFRRANEEDDKVLGKIFKHLRGRRKIMRQRCCPHRMLEFLEVLKDEVAEFEEEAKHIIAK